jgi:hypothetical protein
MEQLVLVSVYKHHALFIDFKILFFPDIDECSIDPPMCSQKCTNNKGGFDCSCSPGYTVGTRDKRICVANGK